MDTPEVLEGIGRQVLAPVLAAWAAAVDASPCRHAGAVPLALLRDGAVLGLAAARRIGHPVAQAWLGRRLMAVAAVAGADDHQNLLNLLVRMRHRPATWAEAADELALPSAPAAHAAAALDGQTLAAFLDWLATPAAAAALCRTTAATRHAVLAHLDGVVPGDGPIMLLDVGYAATVQRCLKRVLALAGRRRTVHGLYLLTSAGARWAMAGDGAVDGVLARLGRPAPFAAALLRHRDVLECLLARPEGELRGHDPDGTPRHGDSALPAAQVRAAARIQAAALDGMAACDGRPETARAALWRLFHAPTAAEAAALGPWRHADATALDGVRRLDDGPADGDRQLTLWPAAARLRAATSPPPP